MTITDVQKRRGRLYCLSLDEEDDVLVDIRTFDESPFRAGSSITNGELESLLAASSYRRMHEKALYLLSLRSYSGGELKKKLAVTRDMRDTADRIIERFEELGLINDESYARSMAESFVRRKNYSRWHAVQELCRRGISRDEAERAVGELEPDDCEQALRIIEKKYARKMDSPDARRRTAAALARAGFGSAAIRNAMKRYSESAGKPEGSDAYNDTDAYNDAEEPGYDEYD